MNDIDITESSKLMMKQMRQRLRWLIESRDLSQRSISSNVSDSEAYIQNLQETTKQSFSSSFLGGSGLPKCHAAGILYL